MCKYWIEVPCVGGWMGVCVSVCRCMISWSFALAIVWRINIIIIIKPIAQHRAREPKHHAQYCTKVVQIHNSCNSFRNAEMMIDNAKQLAHLLLLVYFVNNNFNHSCHHCQSVNAIWSKWQNPESSFGKKKNMHAKCQFAM